MTVHTNSGHHAAYRKILDLLCTHRLKPGQILSQKELVEMVGMTLSPVRLALARLETEGFVAILPQHGIKLIEPSLTLFKDLLQIRITIEKEAWSRYALSNPPEVFEDMIAVHEEYLKECEQGITDALMERVSEYDKGMHTMVVESIGNARLAEMFRVLNLTIYFLRADRGDLRPNTIRNALNVHIEMLNAAKKRDVAELVEIVERHILNATRALLAV